ncbi:MAG TPA: PDZ domain-containing protein [Nitrososphaera sp.]|nr:PDZ domain-containing protein [Nitrososphaera sp.]
MHSPVTTGVAFVILIAIVVGAFSYVSANPLEIRKEPWFGFRGSPLTPELAEAAGFAGQQGFLVMVVEADGPARAAGLKGGDRLASVAGDPACLGGDLILQINGNQVISTEEILSVLETSEVGDTVDLRIMRGSDPPFNISVVLGENPNRPPGDLEDMCT